MKGEKIDNIFLIHKQLGKNQIRGAIAECLYSNQGKNLADATQNFLEHRFSQVGTTRFIKRFQGTIEGFLRAESDDNQDFIVRCKKEIVQTAKALSIPLDKDIDLILDKNTPFNSISVLDLEGLDEASRVKESLRWINCLTKFYAGVPLLKEKETNKESSIATETKKMEDAMKSAEAVKATFEQAKTRYQQEELVYHLWEKGYLKCDLNK